MTPLTPRPGRRDLLLLRCLLLAVVAFAALDWLVRPVVGWVRGTALPVAYEGPAQVAQLQVSGVRVVDASYTLLLPDPASWQRVVELLPGLIALAVVTAAVMQVARVVAAIGSGDPFGAGTTRRLATLSGLLLAGWIVAAAARGLSTMIVLGGSDIGRLEPQAIIPLQVWPFLLGLLTAVLAEAFATGARLREDVEGLV